MTVFDSNEIIVSVNEITFESNVKKKKKNYLNNCKKRER